MPTALILGAASLGVSLLGGVGQAGAIRTARRQASMMARIERSQIAQQAAWAAEDRSRGLAALLGSQRAATAAAGVSGGRTATLLEAETRQAAHRQGVRADYEARHRLQASRMGEMARRASLTQQLTQSRVDMFAGALSAGAQLYGDYQDFSAGRG